MYTENMPDALSDHSSHQLHDGRILVTGGDSTGKTFIFNPEGDEWTTTGSLASERIDHSSILLKDGRVLMTGGRGNYNFVNWFWEIYNP